MAAGQLSAGQRLDALPVGSFHYKIVMLVSLGLFLDGFDVYLAGGVLGSLVKSGWSNLDLNAQFVSVTFVGMLIGALTAGIVGDRFGRRAWSCPGKAHRVVGQGLL